MDGLEFELHKVRREIQRNGNEYVFYRNGKNEYGEPVGESDKVCIVKGIYHEERGYVSLKIQDGANIKSKSEPQILCVIRQGDDGYDSGFLVPFEVEEEGDIVNDQAEDETDHDVSERVLKQGDIVRIGLQIYKVVNITDIQNYGIIANISLELVV